MHAVIIEVDKNREIVSLSDKKKPLPLKQIWIHKMLELMLYSASW